MLLYQDNSSDALTGRNLLNVLNNRASSSAATRPVTRTRVLATTSSAGYLASNIYTVLYLYYICIHIYDSSGSDDGSSGPPMPYSFRYNVAGDETGTYMAREEESDGTTVQLLTADQSQRTSPRAHL